MKKYQKQLPKTLQVSIISRFLNEEELEDFRDKYIDHRFRTWNRGYTPTELDWKMYHNPGTSLEDWQKHWKEVKGKETLLRRLGKMTVLRSETKLGKI